MDNAELYERIKKRGGIADLSQRAKFVLTGADRLRYLNGQVSNDVRKLTGDRTLYACVMTAKGKMCGDVFISMGRDALWIDAEPLLRESLAARLERYIISDDVALEDVTERFGIIHRILPRGAHSRVAGDATHFRSCLCDRFFRGGFGIEGCDFVVANDQFSSVWENFAAHSVVIDPEMLEVLRIESGLPRWGFELTEDTIPVEAGLDKTAIDYAKGCYIGQEIISRLKSIGHVNKHLSGFAAREPLTAGMTLHPPGDSEKSVGRITSAAFSFGLPAHIALGYLNRGVNASALVARDADGRSCEVEVTPLPFIP